MKKFSYALPTSLNEALSLLVEHGPRARCVAGGTDVMVNAKRGRLEEDLLVSLRRIEELRGVREEDGRIVIGGLTTLSDLVDSELLAARLPALIDAAQNMASVQIRNIATVAGNIANAAPSADTAPPLLISGAVVRAASSRGFREVPLDEFFVGPGRTVLEPGEIITEFVIPAPAEPYGQAFWKHSRRKAMDLAMVSVGVHLELEPDLATCRLARIALGVAGPTPIRTPEAEAKLVGRKVDEDLLAEIGNVSCDETVCRDSLRGEAWYRQEIIKVMVRRMGLLALERARAGK